MNNYGRMKPFIREVLDATGNEKFQIYPGPELPDIPEPFVVCTRYGGPGMDADGAIDQISWQFRSVGPQANYDAAEAAADAIDIAMISHFSAYVGGVWVSEIQRVGGPPTSLMTDEADRTHFVGSYTVSVELALNT